MTFTTVSGLLRLQPVAICIVAALLGLSLPGLGETVTLVPIPNVRQFPEATEPGVITYACSQSAESLAAYFHSQGLRFEPSLVRKQQSFRACHIHYRPTVAGFRAAPDDRPITALHAAANPMSFIVGRQPTGDTLDVLKVVLPKLVPPIEVVLRVSGGFDQRNWPAALDRHFPDGMSRPKLRPSGALHDHPWVQDHMKSGQAGGRLCILTPRRLFEGRASDGEANVPLLDNMKSDIFVRSRLSWEGGDLQVVGDPRKPGDTILFHGQTARLYWGADLEPREVSWILRTEFGTDSVIDLSSVGPHADYLVSFLPADSIALVAQPVYGSTNLIDAVLHELERLNGAGSMTALRERTWRLLSDGADDQSIQAITRIVAALRARLSSLPPPADEELDNALVAYEAQYCPGNPDRCFDGLGKNRMLAVAPDLLRRATDHATAVEQRNLATNRLLALFEAQLPGAPPLYRSELEQVAAMVRRLGFRVIRVPFLPVWHEMAPWAGISYVNLLAVNRALFVPQFGLGKFEEKLYSDLRGKLARGYEVVPAPSRALLLDNGGVHCVFGIVRSVEPGRPEDRARRTRFLE